MRKSLSIYLDLLRLVAALGVFAGHASGLLLPWEPKIIGGQASESVAVFFVLSGFVIAYVTTEKEKSWQAYLSARFARISSVVLLAIAVGFILDRIGLQVNIAPYRSWHGWNFSPSIYDFISYITFTNELWFRHTVLGTLEPYWSLGFEVIYYAFFGILFFARGWWRALALVGLGLAAGPKVIVFLPVWLIGVGLYALIRRRTKLEHWHPAAGAILIFSSIVGFYVLRYKVFSPHVENMYEPTSAFNLLRSAIYYYLLGIIVAANVFGFDLLAGDKNVWAPRVAKTVRWCAGGTFSIYLFHLPMVVFAAAMFPAIPHSRILGVMGILGILIAIYALAEIGERRKGPYKRLADAILPAHRRIEPAFGTAPPVDV